MGPLKTVFWRSVTVASSILDGARRIGDIEAGSDLQERSVQTRTSIHVGEDWPPEAPPRRLASIAVLDVVGYSGLMDADEAGTHARWSKMCTALIKPSVATHRGQIVKSTGDGFLVEFRSVVDSVRWALSLQQMIRGKGPSVLPVRIALHIGDIIPEENDIFGSDVNIAARMQGIASPGGIVVSAAVHERVHRLVDYAAEDCGLIALKNIRLPIHAFSIFPVDQRPSLNATPRRETHQPSIAVLRPRACGDEPIDPSFIEGIVHEIVASLAGLKELFVISSSSTVGLPDAIPERVRIGEGLGVRYILAGSIARSGERLRLSSELSDLHTAEVIWSGRHEVSRDELFTTQAAIAGKIAYSLIPHLRQSELQRALRKPPADIGAYALVLQALHRFHRSAEGDFETAHELLHRAIQQDPTYSAAYAWQARWYWRALVGLTRATLRPTPRKRIALPCSPWNMTRATLLPLRSTATASHFCSTTANERLTRLTARSPAARARRLLGSSALRRSCIWAGLPRPFGARSAASCCRLLIR
jgi:class 3 adenylate cyclase